DYLLINGKIDFFAFQSLVEFRRLYHLVNGSPHLRSSFPSISVKKPTNLTEEEFDVIRARYRDIISHLGKYKELILDICVFNIPPKQSVQAAVSCLHEFLVR
ncbi:MAG: hypothetical protein ACHP6I_01030, partial [Rickettsiales bacterium]